MRARTVLRTARRLLRPRTYSEWRTALRLQPAVADGSAGSDVQHAKATAQWLLQSQAGCRDGKGPAGYSAGYSLFTGWLPPFPETTGYIIPTMLGAATTLKSPSCKRSALEAAEWLLTQQQKDGSFLDLDGEKRVFDTGQILFGLLAAHRATNDARYLDAAMRAADWMVAQQERDGRWVRGTYRGKARTYYSRAAWALAQMWAATGDRRYRAAATKQLRWVMRQQRADGWFANASFDADDRPVLHTIAYTIEGLWESGALLGEKSMQQAARRAAERLLADLKRHKSLAAYYSGGWQRASDERCVTGMAQTALIFSSIGDEKYKRAVRTIKEEIKQYQQLGGPQEIRGGIPGSVPILGQYMRGTYPNWAAKFTMDLMMRG